MQARGRFLIIFGVVLLALVIVGAVLIWVLGGRGRATPTAPPSEAREQRLPKSSLRRET